MSLILKNAVKQVDEKSKSYFVDKLKEYDYLIDENLKTYENDTNKKFFIYENGNINLLISIAIHPVEIEEIFKIITIE